MLGAYLQQRPVVKKESIVKALKNVLPEKYHHLLPINEQAMEIGASIASQWKEQPAFAQNF
jgi:2-oxoglutarate ferredoxin oxidoreductase subunit gamma